MFTEEIIQQVWNDTAIPVEGYDAQSIRHDCCGAFIIRSEYGNANSPFGWEIDHVFPQSAGGDDYLPNLRALNWKNNRAKGDDFPVYKVAVQAHENSNIDVDKQFQVNDELYATLRSRYGF